MLNMFKALEASGLRGFLGCPSVFCEKELERFFDTALVQDGDIIGAVSGMFFAISESRFAEVLKLPTEGLVFLSETPKNLVYDAMSIFSKSGEPISTYGKKRLMKNEFRLLNDILAKSITVKAGSFDAVTNERFLMMTAIHFGIKVPMFVEKGTVAESEGSKDVVVAKAFEKSVRSNQTNEEKMSLDYLMMQISDYMMLPSVTVAEITKIKSDFPVKIKEVHYQDWYYASLPKISGTEKGNALLEEADTVKGNPATVMVQLICADVDFLVQMRQQSRVCTEVIRYSMFGCMRPVVGINLCRDIVVHSSAVDVIEKIPNKFGSVFQQGVDTNSFVGYFSDSGVQSVLQSVQDIELLSSYGSTVYRSPSSQSDTIFDQDDLMDFHANNDSDEQTSDHQFDLPVSTTNVESTPAVAQFSLPAIDIKESFAQLRASIDDILFEQIRKIRTDFGMTLLTNSRKDSQDLRAVLSLDLSTSQKKLSTQVAATALDNVDVRKEVKALNAKVTYLDEQVVAMRNDLLNFHAKEEENHLNLSTQLDVLFDYINRGGDAKKGESGSSQPRPPPDDQSRPWWGKWYQRWKSEKRR
ncbi:hypothetical protein F511_35901 [Dorcoceras hygrometricum]|uniref:Dystroglycan-like n=1 Tax=Dorcoceras hygrometricum TaxID=472368 RepID=A0A2Z7DEC3_9LAMI|nr:hypothetical protein F511_35901 [Dorcoceras hygrometricum]